MRPSVRGIVGPPGGARPRERGVALLTVLILGLVFSILGLSIYSMATYEWGQTKFRDDSGSAFWLAEAAIEHAKGELFNDITWDSGFAAPETLGEGTYTLAFVDTTVGVSPAARMYARGFVPKPGGGSTERDVEILATVFPAAFEYAIFSMHDIHTTGNMGVCGRVHANEDLIIDGSSMDPPDSCGADTTKTSGFTITPPTIRTEPDYYGLGTYYFVVGKPAAGVQDSVWIVTPDPAGALTIRTGVKVRYVASMKVANYNAGPIAYDFNTAKATSLFDWTTGICKRDTAGADLYVVVNFGECLNVGPQRLSNLSFNADVTIKSTIVNTRYIAYPDTSLTGLLNTANWSGGNLSNLQKIIVQPASGIAIIAHNFNDTGVSNISIGTPANPAVFYLTGDMNGVNANGNFYGTVVVLGSIGNTSPIKGNADFWFNNGYRVNLPPYLNGFWTPGTSGVAEIIYWREPPPLYTS